MHVAEITLEQAEAVIAAHREREYAARAEEARQYIGRYFRRTNRVSGEGDPWWMYAMPTQVDDLGTLSGLMFQSMSTGTVEVIADHRLHIPKRESWQEISRAEFWNAASDVCAELVALLSRPERVP